VLRRIVLVRLLLGHPAAWPPGRWPPGPAEEEELRRAQADAFEVMAAELKERMGDLQRTEQALSQERQQILKSRSSLATVQAHVVSMLGKAEKHAGVGPGAAHETHVMLDACDEPEAELDETGAEPLGAGAAHALSLGPGALGDIWMQRASDRVSAATANVVLATEPLFAAALARALLGECLGMRGTLGAGLIFTAAALAGSLDRGGS